MSLVSREALMMMELPRFKKHFKQYGFKWMKRVPRKYSDVLVKEFYAAYKVKLKIQYPQVQLWKGGDLVPFVMVQGVRVDISPHTI